MPETATVQAKEPVADDTAKWKHVLTYACDLTVELPVPGFRLGDLAHLAPQMIIDSHWQVGEDVPLRLNGELVAWSEFEVVSNRLAVRITELQA